MFKIRMKIRKFSPIAELAVAKTFRRRNVLDCDGGMTFKHDGAQLFFKIKAELV